MTLLRGRRKYNKDAAATPKERKRVQRAKEGAERSEDIAILDFETEPFDKTNPLIRVRPFLAVLHSHQFETIVIWEEDAQRLIDRTLAAIEALPRAFTIYAHNGGKFDFMFFVHRLRGEVMFKGRGIMSCKIGAHDLRDSFHLIPEKLSTYRKDDFDYNNLKPENRNAHRATIIDYCINDCVYTLEIITAFIARHGRKISIGQAAKASVKNAGYFIEKLNDAFDAYLRNFYFGGRVECLSGIGHFISRLGHQYKLFDVNSMYPTAMRNFAHPVGGQKSYLIRKGKPNAQTVFVDLNCSNYGALVLRTDEGETSATNADGRFRTTIWEYDAATELGLIENVTINYCIDCSDRTTFQNFVDPFYATRLLSKAKLAQMKKEGRDNEREFFETKIDDIFAKLFLNNAYGKEAQNPRRFKETFFTDYGQRPNTELTGFKCCELVQQFVCGIAQCKVCGLKHPGYGPLPVYEDDVLDYAIWERPPKRLAFNNVGTAASITGAARAMLMRAIAAAVDPIYCDTDSVICADLPGLPIHKTELGAWDIEDEYSEVIIAGKKLYACKLTNGKFKYRMKGSAGAEWQDYLDMLAGAAKVYVANGPTMTRRHTYSHMEREVKATGPKTGNVRLLSKRATS